MRFRTYRAAKRKEEMRRLEEIKRKVIILDHCHDNSHYRAERLEHSVFHRCADDARKSNKMGQAPSDGFRAKRVVKRETFHIANHTRLCFELAIAFIKLGQYQSYQPL